MAQSPSRRHHLLVEPVALDHLEELAQKVPADRCIVELGVYQGESLYRLGTGAASGSGCRVYGVDPWGLPGAYPDRPQMLTRYGHQNMFRAERKVAHLSNVKLIRDFSTNVGVKWGGPPVGLLFIDAVHTEEAVLLDHAAWMRHLAEDAYVCFDDHCPRFPGVIRAVERLYGDRFHVVGTRLVVTRGR